LRMAILSTPQCTSGIIIIFWDGLVSSVATSVYGFAVNGSNTFR
jgi:hypothetical protein